MGVIPIPPERDEGSAVRLESHNSNRKIADSGDMYQALSSRAGFSGGTPNTRTSAQPIPRQTPPRRTGSIPHANAVLRATSHHPRCAAAPKTAPPRRGSTLEPEEMPAARNATHPCGTACVRAPQAQACRPKTSTGWHCPDRQVRPEHARLEMSSATASSLPAATRLSRRNLAVSGLDYGNIIAVRISPVGAPWRQIGSV